MNRQDDMRIYELLYNLLNKGYLPTYYDIRYAAGLMLEASKLKASDENVKNNASLYGEIIGKAYLFLMLYDQMYFTIKPESEVSDENL